MHKQVKLNSFFMEVLMEQNRTRAKKESVGSFKSLHLLIFSIIFLGFSGNLNAQKWDKYYTGILTPGYFPVCQTYDKGFAICTYEPNQLKHRILKTDANGNIIWTCNITDSSQFSAVSSTNDGGLILGGVTGVMGNQSGDACIMKLDACGKKEWCAIYAHYFEDFCWVNQISQTKDGGYIVSLAGYGVNSTMLSKVSATGKSEWAVELSSNVTFDNVFEDKDGDFISTTNIYDPAAKACTEKINPKGKIIWQHVSALWSFGFASVQTNDKGYLTAVTELQSKDPHHAARIMKQDSLGNELMCKKIGDSTKDEFITFIISDPLSNTYLGYSSIDFDLVPGGPTYPKLYKLNEWGNVLDSLSYPKIRAGVERVLRTYDNKFLIFGTAGSPQALHLWKVNSDLTIADLNKDNITYNYKCTNMPKTSTVDMKGYIVIKIDTINNYEKIADSSVNTSMVRLPEYNPAMEYRKFYPNPTNGLLNIDLGYLALNASFTILDLTGKQVLAGILSNTKTPNINLQSLKQGLYILSIKQKNGAVVRERIVKE